MPRRKLTTRERIRKFRRKDPMMTSYEIGRRLGLNSRGIRRHIAEDEDLFSRPPKLKNVYYCMVCNEAIDGKRKFCNSKCRFKYYRILVHCSYCHIPFYRIRNQIILSHRRGAKNIYCSYKCRERGKKKVERANFALDKHFLM